MKKILMYLILSIPLTMSGSTGNLDAISRIDITGNWQDENGFKATIQTREPELKDGEVKIFFQELRLTKGSYNILFEYDPEFDKEPGSALENNLTEFKGFEINGKVNPVTFSATTGKKDVYLAKSGFTVSAASEVIKLKFAIHNTRMIRTRLEGVTFTRENKHYFAIDPGSVKECLLIHQIPFMVRKADNLQYGVALPKLDAVDRGSLKPWEKGMNFNLDGTKVNKIHFLGMIHKIDVGQGAWNSLKGDNGYSHFIGDKAGDILITYQDNKQVAIPLIFGFNLWYGRPWDMFWFHYPGGASDNSARLNFDSDLFSGDPEPRKIIENTVCLTDGTRLIGSRSSNTRFIFSLDMENKPVKSIEVKGVNDMYEYPLISAITVETASPSPILSTLPNLSQGVAATKPVKVQYILNKQYQAGIEKLKRSIYSFKDELPKLTQPEIPTSYFGPRYNFKGTQEAIYAATYLFRNGPECGSKIADNGTTCSSSIARSQTIRYALGTGIWRGFHPLFGDIQNWFHLYQTKSPGELSGAGQAWSRGIGELMREAMALGYGKFINTYTDWLDSCLFSESNPPHWGRIPGIGIKTSWYTTRLVGNEIEKGNRENDGHGICMWGRYMVHHWLGHPTSWNERHWNATKAAVDWIQWQLNTDTIFPGKRVDLLFTESESGNYEFYSSYNCLHGLNLSIRMAKELGKTAEVEAWTKLYIRLQKGILDKAVVSSDFGPIWFTNSKHWMDDAQKMAHIQLATDGVTYTPLQDYALGDSMEQKYLEIDKNTYRFIMKDKNYNCLRMYGYGQGMMAQSALLMDEMNDAENFINLLVDHCYLPKMEGWAAPEGITLHKSGEYWMPVCGYLGQDSHLADSQKALRLMLGIDDNNTDHLRLVPRYPLSWNQMAISDFPVLTGNKRQNINYSYVRDEKGQVFKYGLENPVNKLSLRLGPIPVGKEIFNATLNDKKVSYEKLTSGDSRWVWINNLSGKQGEVKIQYQ